MQLHVVRRSMCCLAVFFAVLLVACTASAPLEAADISTGNEIVLIDPNAEAIYNKVEQLAHTKAAAQQYRTLSGLSHEEALSFSEYQDISVQEETLRTELIQMGAKPDAETLQTLFSSGSRRVNNDFDLPAFLAMCGNAYDMWGVYQQVNASYGTYYTYEILIQDITGGSLLATHVEQNGAPGFEIFTTNGDTALQTAITEGFWNFAFDRLKKYEEKFDLPIPGLVYITRLRSALSFITNANELLLPNQAVTSSGHTKSYRIYCDAAPVLSFVFVKDSPNGEWVHTYTTNYYAIRETHDWYIVFNQNGSLEALNDERTFNYTEYPDNYAYRLTNGITAYRNNDFYYHKQNRYSVVGVVPDVMAREVFLPEVYVPLEKTALFS